MGGGQAWCFFTPVCRQEDHVTFSIPYGIKAQPHQQRLVGQGNLLGTIFVPIQPYGCPDGTLAKENVTQEGQTDAQEMVDGVQGYP